MPLDISALAAKKRTIPVEWDGETIEITYRTAGVNPAYQSMLQKLDTKKLDQETQWEAVLGVLDRWDIVEDGKPAPITKETFAKLPTSLLVAISNAMIADTNPNPKSGKPSAAGSFRKGN
jgi:hypothetical protein